MKSRQICLTAALFLTLLTHSAFADLAHRYSFNDGTSNDSVGTANGNLYNGASVTGGQLVFSSTLNNGTNNPTSGQFMSLPSDLLNTKTFTIEAWATEQSYTAWQRIIDFGNPGNNPGSGYIIVTPYNGSTDVSPTGQVSINKGSANTANYSNYSSGPVPSTTHIPVNHEFQIAYVYDYANDTQSLFVNGVLINTNTATDDPTAAAFTNFFVGKSEFSADPYFDGSIDELRLYNQALTPAQVAAEYAAGPNVVAVPEPVAACMAMFAIAMISRRRRGRGDVKNPGSGY